MIQGALSHISTVADKTDIVEVSTLVSPIILNMNGKKSRHFLLSPIIDAAVILSLLAADRSTDLKTKFSIDASDPLNKIQLPDDFVMSSGQFNDATKEWTPIPGDTGAYTLTAWFDGANWNTQIVGPDNT